MVVGEAFAWGHLGKTAGDATLRLFELFPEVILFADSARSVKKHARFSQRSELIAGKLLALNLRRLPAWMLSYAIQESISNRTPMRSPRELADSDLPDRKLRSFLDNGPLTVDRWLRTESLKRDFIAFVSELTDVSEERKQAVLALPRVNARTYDHDVSHWLTQDHVAMLYRRNPLWTRTELAVFGDLVELEAEAPAGAAV